MSEEQQLITKILPAGQVLQQYADYLQSESYCIDVSSWPIKVLHANSNRNQVVENLELEFPSWSRSAGIRVVADGYAEFRRTLKTRLMERLPRISGQSFRPVENRFIRSRGALVANSYHLFDPEPPSCLKTPSILQEFLDRILPNAAEQKIVLQFFAHLIQRPQQRPQFGLIITGVGGVGKSLMVQLAEAALGGFHWWRENDYSPALKQFSEVFPNNLLVTFDDAIAGRNTYEDLKQEITREFKDVEIKGQQKTLLREVYSRVVVLSNDSRPLRLVNDRRFYVPTPCVHRESPEESEAFGHNFYSEWFDKPETAAWLYHWFRSIDISDFNHATVIRTETHAMMCDASSSALEKYIGAYIEHAPIFHERQLVEYLSREGLTRIIPDDLKLKLTAHGYMHKRQDCPSGNGMVWLWKPNAKRSRSLTDEERAAVIQAVTF